MNWTSDESEYRSSKVSHETWENPSPSEFILWQPTSTWSKSYSTINDFVSGSGSCTVDRKAPLAASCWWRTAQYNEVQQLRVLKIDRIPHVENWFNCETSLQLLLTSGVVYQMSPGTTIKRKIEILRWTMMFMKYSRGYYRRHRHSYRPLEWLCWKIGCIDSE